MGDTPEYLTIKKLQPQLRIGFKNNMTDLAIAFNAEGLIDGTCYNHVTLVHSTLHPNEKADIIFESVLQNVQLSSEKFDRMKIILSRKKINEPVVKLLEEEYANQVKLAGATKCSTKEDKPKQRSEQGLCGAKAARPARGFTGESKIKQKKEQGSTLGTGIYRSKLNTYKQKKVITTYYIKEEQQDGKYKATAEAELSDGRRVTGKCRKLQPTKREALENAAKSLIIQVEQVKRAEVQKQRLLTSIPPSNPSSSAAVKTPKTVLKEYCDSKWKGNEEVKYSTKDVATGGFRSTVSCADIGPFMGDVKTSKQEAEQSAAAKATSAAVKTSKSVLKEYCDRKWKGKEEVKYDTRNVAAGGFRSTVTCADIGPFVGDVKPNKQEAEQNAAAKAISILKI